MAISVPDLLKLTWRALQADWVRSGLTGLGVFMGVAAVSATLNIADITNAQIEQKLAERDQPYIVPYLQAESEFEESDITAEDQVALKRTIPEIRAISSVSQVWGIRAAQFEGTEVKDVQTAGVTQNYIDTTGRRILQGRFFNPTDFEQYHAVAIVDEKLATLLFKHQSPLNQAIYAAGNRLLVVGVVETKAKAEEYMRSSGALWLPKPLAQSLGGFTFSRLQISPHRLKEMPLLEAQVKQALEKRHPHTTAFSYGNAKDLVKERELQQTAARALAVVGLIALGIGGVGIANITIAAVLERTPEIGLRRAIGATRLEIMVQFILESVILSVIGGVSAIIVVQSLTQLIPASIRQVPYRFSWQNAALSMGGSDRCGGWFQLLPSTTSHSNRCSLKPYSRKA